MEPEQRWKAMGLEAEKLRKALKRELLARLKLQLAEIRAERERERKHSRPECRAQSSAVTGGPELLGLLFQILHGSAKPLNYQSLLIVPL